MRDDLEATNKRLRADLAQRTAEVAEAWLTNATLRADLARANAERDEARRELCELKSRLGADYYVPSLNPEGYAKVLGWDCFDAPHATDGRVQNGGAA
jgi:sugar phosphate isomerase/epimerase